MKIKTFIDFWNDYCENVLYDLFENQYDNDKTYVASLKQADKDCTMWLETSADLADVLRSHGKSTNGVDSLVCDIETKKIQIRMLIDYYSKVR